MGLLTDQFIDYKQTYNYGYNYYISTHTNYNYNHNNNNNYNYNNNSRNNIIRTNNSSIMGNDGPGIMHGLHRWNGNGN